MDFLAHGLWGGAVFGRRPRSTSWKWAFLCGIAPDLIAFGPAIVAGILTGDYVSWASYPRDGIPKTFLSELSYHGYQLSHSLIVWSCIAAALWLWQKRFAWAWGAWALHILCDIPLHATRYFPTPYLWPFHTPLHNGIPWANRRFMLVNYGLLGVTYLAFAVMRKRHKIYDANERKK